MPTYAEELAAAKTTVTITPEPLILEKAGATWRGMFIGLSTFTKTDPKTGEIKTLPLAHFYDGSKILFNMGAQLTRALANLRTGVSVEIVLKELKANAHGGKTKIYSITPLTVPIKDVNDIFGGVLSIAAPATSDLLPPPAEHAKPAGPDYDNEADAAALWAE